MIERLRDAALALRKAQAERDQLEAEKFEPIAIVGMGCRLPGGANNPDAYWALLDAGGDAVVPLDARWAWLGAQAGPDVPRWAGLLEVPLEQFDPGFFGISPREAKKLDPQQRLLLEVAWEALEDAGLAPDGLDGTATGMFLGACSSDYRAIAARESDDQRDAYNATGNVNSIAAGRVSFTLGLRGPCMTIDTACSSSLVAVHLACRSLRSRESDLALAGGVNVILSPEWMEGIARTQALSPDGRCSTFDAMANGFVRAEGCGMVVLKRLSDAVRDGDRIRAVIRGSAINQDGRSTGLTTPNVLAQQAVLRDALADARVAPDAIGFVETHGTGTSLGDPIEVEALRALMPARPDAAPCWLGAVKTNLGHLEAGAGVAGLIKTVLVLEHEQVPRNLNFRALNPRIQLAGSAVAPATEAHPWPRSERPRFAGVSSFGLSGTNAHVVLEEAPVAPARALPSRPAELLVVSARTPAALAAQVDRLAAHLRGGAALAPAPALADIGFSLATARSAMEHRLAVAAGSRDALCAALEAAARGATPAGVVRGAAGRLAGRPAFLFTGQGAQLVGMGRGLHAAWPAFREAFDRCAALFDAALERPLREAIWADPDGADAALIDQTAYTQPALFAVEYALYALWRAWGVAPGFVAGHSIGELVAACVAGVFSLEDAVRLVAARGRLMQALPAGGAMVSIAAAEAEVAAGIAAYADAVSIAAVNGPAQIVIAGGSDAVEAVAAAFAARGVRTRKLAVSHAFHSPLMAPMLEAFRRAAESIKYHPPTIPLVSNLTGQLVTTEVTEPAYWVRHVRETVRFADGLAALHRAGARTFVELGPRPALLGLVESCLPGEAPVVVRAMRAGRDEAASALEGLGAYWVNGNKVAWKAVFPAECRRVELPTYAFQREPYWVDVDVGAVAAPAPASVGPMTYRLDWPEVPRPGAAAAVTARSRWLVVSDGARLGEPLAAALRDQGHACALIAGATGAELEAALAAAPACDGVVYLASREPVDAERAGPAEALERTA
ncbi:MAG TPA: type I polyketide synthase, partial [Kofleriaceae bacterium]|nr:type I polyketide synthase [Kofleriaceae bacterium]